SLHLIEKEHIDLKKLKDEHKILNDEHKITKRSLKESVSTLKKDLKKNISSNTSSSKSLEKSARKTDAKLKKVETALQGGLSQIKDQMKGIIPIIAKYDRKSEQYLVQQFKRFEVYSKDIEGTIDSKFEENSLILNNALDTINRFVKEQEDLRGLEIRENLKDHRQIKADINVMKEEFSTIISEYGKIEKDIDDIKKSELKKEEKHIIGLVTELRKDIKDVDKAIDSEKMNIKKIVSDVINIEKKRMDNSLENSKKYVDDNVKLLCGQVATLTARNEQLVKLLENKEKEYDTNRSDMIDTQSKKIEDLLRLLNESQRANNEKSDIAIKEIRAENESRYDNKLNELVALLDKFRERDREREKRLPDLMVRLEDTISILSSKAKDPEVLEKNVKDELDRMMAELRQMRDESAV
ncbi:MAG: hypothetical protein KAS90_06685, partial [Candidatus Aenigmarchaeota archaeon]|nr:hypothetical protein [Candidatus Aenigmarchaeota archaeon]